MGRGDQGAERGAAAVEFALVLIPLMLIVMGILEYGIIFSRQQVITNAAREGARAGSLPALQASALSDAQSAARHYLSVARLSCTGGCTVSATPETVNGANAVRVTITMPWTRITAAFVPVPSALSSEAVMRANF